LFRRTSGLTFLKAVLAADLDACSRLAPADASLPYPPLDRLNYALLSLHQRSHQGFPLLKLATHVINSFRMCPKQTKSDPRGEIPEELVADNEAEHLDAEEDDNEPNLGCSWLELALDFFCATHVKPKHAHEYANEDDMFQWQTFFALAAKRIVALTANNPKHFFFKEQRRIDSMRHMQLPPMFATVAEPQVSRCSRNMNTNVASLLAQELRPKPPLSPLTVRELEFMASQWPCNNARRLDSVEQDHICRCWKYINHDCSTTVSTSMIYECNGEILFQSQGSVTGWHGRFEELRGGERMIFWFDYQGRSRWRFQPTMVLHVGRQIYKGYDYASRRITVSYQGEFIWCRPQHNWVHSNDSWALLNVAESSHRENNFDWSILDIEDFAIAITGRQDSRGHQLLRLEYSAATVAGQQIPQGIQIGTESSWTARGSMEPAPPRHVVTVAERQGRQEVGTQTHPWVPQRPIGIAPPRHATASSEQSNSNIGPVSQKPALINYYSASSHPTSGSANVGEHSPPIQSGNYAATESSISYIPDTYVDIETEQHDDSSQSYTPDCTWCTHVATDAEQQEEEWYHWSEESETPPKPIWVN
jgi:hypothetical protein